MINSSISKQWQVWLTIVISLIVILGITRVLTGSSGFPAAFPSALVAWGTLMLAIATIRIVISSRELESQRKKDELARDMRNRDAAWLSDIIDWAVEVVKISAPPMSGVGFVNTTTEKADRRRILDTLIILGNSFRAMIAMSLYASRIGLAFGESLQRRINELDGYLRTQDEILRKCINITVERKPTELMSAWKELIDNWDKLSDSAANVVDEAVIEKLTILNI